MKLSKQLIIFGLAGIFGLQACNEEPKEQTQEQAPIVITNNDVEQAKELYISNPVIDSTWLIDSSNTGFGQRQDFNADSALAKKMYAQEENTDWYKFVAPADTSLVVTVEPNDPVAEYDMVIFKSTGDSVGPDLRKGLIPAIRSNFAKRSLPEDTITGLDCWHKLPDHTPADSSNQFSKAYWMQKGDTYYIVLNTTTPKGLGYKLRIHSCAPGDGGSAPSKPMASTSSTQPEIKSFFPSKAGEGKRVTILGKHFTGASSVSFGGTGASSFSVDSDNKISAVVSSGNSGTVNVTTANGSADKDGFTWLEKSQRKMVRKQTAARKSRPTAHDDGDYYIVKPKDTMFSIAFVFGMTVEEIMKLNKLENTNVFVGQKLRVVRRQLPQKAIEAKHAVAKPVKPSAPVKGSTTDPKVIEATKEDPKPVEKIAEKGIEEMKPMENKTATFNQTPNLPKEKTGLTSKTEEKNALAPADKSFYVYCNVTSGVNKQPVGGTLQVVDLKKKSLVYNVQANKTQAVPLFNEGGKQKLIIADIFGYKKQDFDLNLDNIINDSTAQQVQIVDDTIVINFELRRIEKGDVAVAYNIFFYDDASVMLPKSTYELDQLLELMQENNKIKIKIHGHTNTSKLGRILYLEKGDQTFFRLTKNNKETFGPARMLSKKRAETIKYYLQSKRINDDRIETEGHGGSQMLYPNTHPLAFKNKRVEIEILAD